MSITLEQFGIDQLSTPERLHLIDLLWDSIPDDVPFSPPQWHIDELEKRLAVADANPSAVEPWESVYARLSRRS
jgi:putative addiction module component (TIGR02574 family)